MKLIIRYCQAWGHLTTFTLEILESITPQELFDKINEKLHFIKPSFITRFKQDGHLIRITHSFPLSFYGLKEKTILYIEKIENSEDQMKMNEERINMRYFEKLGLLNSITEEEEKEKGDDDEESKENSSSTVRNFQSFKNSKTPSSRDSKNLSPCYENDAKAPKIEKSFEVKSYIETQIELLLKETKNGNKEEIITVLETFTDVIPEQFLEEVRMKKKKLFDEIGSGGWNALHFAVFYGKSDICTIFIDRKPDVNKKTQTDEGWTPLQLAVQKNHFDIAKLLLKTPNIDVNILTPKGTALHLACKYNRTALALLILTSPGCNPDIKNFDGYVAADLTSNAELISACERYSKTPKYEPVEITPEDENEAQFVKPPVVTGCLYKIGRSNMRLNQRYFVLNADDGTFIRFRSKSDYPLKPMEIIALKDIKDIKYKKDPGFLLRGKFNYYLEIKAGSSTQILACLYHSTFKAWANHLNNGRLYCISVENKLKDMKTCNDDEGLLQFIKRLSVNKKDYTITIEDQEKEEDRLLAKTSIMMQNVTSKLPPTFSNKKVTSNVEIKRSNSQKILDANVIQPEKTMNPFELRRKTSSPLLTTSDKTGEDEDIPANLNEEKLCFKSFKIIKVLGSGAFGKVFMVKKKDDGKIFAMKALRKRTLMLKKQMKYAISEANILKNSDHPFILKLHYCFQTPQFLYMVLDYCSSGDLSLILAQQPESKFEENIAKFYIAELILAIEYLHQKNIIYRDLKPENILINEDGHIKLADFGLSKEGVGDGDRTKSFCGSPAYLSPEMVRNKGATKATDIYGIGTVLYEMIVGSPPYYDDDLKTMYRNIDEGNLIFPLNMSVEAQDLIRKLMCKDPESRIGVKDKVLVKNHAFFHGIEWDKVLDKEYAAPQIVEQDEDNFNAEKGLNQFIDHDYDEYNGEVNRVKDFSFSEN